MARIDFGNDKKRHSKSALYMYIYNGGQGNISLKYLRYYCIFLPESTKLSKLLWDLRNIFLNILLRLIFVLIPLLNLKH